MQTNLLKPKTINVEQLAANRAKVTLEPFERGYGHTLGNALRRVLLSSMVGYAATEVTIAGVLHEYSSIDGVQEDVVNILLNLKGVVFKLQGRDEVTLSLRKEGDGIVTARDIQTPHDVEIINPDHVIATLSHGAKLDMQIKVETGRGYVPGNMRRFGDEPNKSIGRIVLDASFSPVRRVSYAVESARVEQRTDLDKLVLEIETNGSINAEDAVRASAKILMEQLAVFAQLDGDFADTGMLLQAGSSSRASASPSAPSASHRSQIRASNGCCRARASISAATCAMPTSSSSDRLASRAMAPSMFGLPHSKRRALRAGCHSRRS